MPTYNTYPAVDENYNFPPKVIDAFVNAPEFRYLRWSKPLAASVSDLNQVLDLGLYPISNTELLNLPVKSPGALTVYTVGALSVQQYTAIDASARTYTRTRSENAVWSAWLSTGWSKIADPNIKNVDLFVEDGLYSVTGAGISNRPVAAAGSLTVRVVNGVVNQEWVTFDPRPRTFIRSRAANQVWSEWLSVVWATPPSITSGSNLDNYKTPGTYIVTSGSVLNKPTTGLGFLEVVAITTTSIIQRWTPFDANSNTFVRHHTSSEGWKVWTSNIWWQGHLTRNVDLNTLTTPSAYSLTWVDHPNRATDRVGTLTITVGGAVTVQTFAPSTGTPSTFRRTLTSGSWTSWEELKASGANTGSVASLALFQAARTSKAPSDIPAVYTTNRSVGFNSNHAGGTLRFTRDDGSTWSDLNTFSDAFSSVRQLPDGQLLAVIGSGENPRSLWRSTGYTDATPAAATWTKVLTASSAHIYYTSAWSFSIHENIILVAEYGPKAPTWNDYSISSPARYVRISKDYGKTWRLVFDLVSYLKNDRKLVSIDGQHLHGVLWDPYWNRIWITFGDDTNGLVYSDDEGATWSTAFWGPSPSAPWQGVGMAALPNCILIGSDGPPNGVWRIDRSQGKTSTTYRIEEAYVTPDDVGLLSHLCQAIHKIPSINGDIHLFGFGTEARPGKTFVVGTRDGYSFTRIWEDVSEVPLGRGVRTIAGPNLKGELIIGSNDERVSELWSEWRGTYTGDPKITWDSIENRPNLYDAPKVDSLILSSKWELERLLSTSDRLENLTSGAYKVASSSVATAMGLPFINSGQLVVYKPYGSVGRAFWYPTSTNDSWQCRQHGGAWLPWELVGAEFNTGIKTFKPVGPVLTGDGEITLQRINDEVTCTFSAVAFNSNITTFTYMTDSGFIPAGYRPGYGDRPTGVMSNSNANPNFLIMVAQSSRFRFQTALPNSSYLPGTGSLGITGQMKWRAVDARPTTP